MKDLIAELRESFYAHAEIRISGHRGKLQKCDISSTGEAVIRHEFVFVNDRGNHTRTVIIEEYVE